ncbi:uncharacterized protein LOC122082644 [Macadamia integrifolia]|uniref:uncharacterized protein LOC122082644 n=1 Tax=Macadamia integrifolia TaxID=60698 RepID=UPI001C4F1785|nr:uncharacterized protein LOC122082644 [Macadamia integrifolia]
MGGCASKPKDVNFSREPLPVDNSTSGEPTLKGVQGEAAAHENNNGGEGQKEEEPLVDLSEPNPEAPKSDKDAPESNTAITDLVSGIGEASDVNHEVAKETEDIVGSGAGNSTTEQTKDDDGPEVAAGPAGQIAIESHKSDDAGQEQLTTPETPDKKD